MTNEQIYPYIDHTLLKPTATFAEIKTLCDEAVRYHTASVCIPPYYVKPVRELYQDLTICTVIGFPNGYNTREVKEFETKNALEHGADEIDMVINQNDVKDGQFVKVKEEIASIKKICGSTQNKTAERRIYRLICGIWVYEIKGR